MGDPVKDAVTVVKFPSTGSYRVWVRTMDWVARWNAPGTPGKFQLVVDGKPRAETFGTKGKAWAWQDGARFSEKSRRRGQLRSRRDRRRIRRDCGGDFHGAHGLQGRARAGSRGSRRQGNERGSRVSDEQARGAGNIRCSARSWRNSRTPRRCDPHARTHRGEKGIPRRTVPTTWDIDLQHPKEHYAKGAARD